ncbi:glycosyltransferase family 39 protein [Roseomonas eburnea]|uniref:Glycosyltransferase family 39 protein n=1 Tax=Neoroseomonas eburnea TaxID=1346889 RepID=A0A9X9XII5_9PROT|nr:glycosyltransferase family 39 protein [Neoroseomonas eburnea]MBR0683521.1 glycosyltransferase family 39 protein [Neoroseomonas eburnea]
MSPDGTILATTSPRRAIAHSRLRRALGNAAVPLFLLLAAILLRAFSFAPAVIDTDEGLYMLQAREWLRGNWPLAEVWDMHPVGAPALFAAIMALLGDAIWVPRLLGVIGTWLTAWALYAIVRFATAPPALGLAAGLLYLAHSTLIGGLATNTEILFTPLTAWSMALGLRAARRALEHDEPPPFTKIVAMGLMIGFALAIKPVAVFEGSLAWLLLVGPAVLRRVISWTRVLAYAVSYAVLCATPTLLFGFAYFLKGDLDDFINGAFIAPLRYAGARVSLLDAGRYTLIAVMILLWAFALVIPAVVRPRTRRGPVALLRWVCLAWFAAATAAVIMPGMYYQHYFLLWLPPLSLLAALGARRLARAARPGLVVAAFALLVGGVSLDAWRSSTVPRLYGAIGLTGPDPVREVAAAIRQVIDPGDRIWVVNYHPTLYVLANAGLATRYAFPAQLVGPYWRVTGIDPYEEVARILASTPQALVIDRGWWPNIRPRVAAMIEEALAENYDLATVVWEERGPVEVWRLR